MIDYFFVIIVHTPYWVALVFFSLLVLGLLQARPHKASALRVISLPLAMLFFSFFGEISAFGWTLEPCLAWGGGLVLAFALSRLGSVSVRTVFQPEFRSLRIPGSWTPLALMMAIFVIKYVLGVALALDLPVRHQLWFTCGISLALGGLSGIFLARVINVLRIACQGVVAINAQGSKVTS